MPVFPDFARDTLLDPAAAESSRHLLINEAADSYRRQEFLLLGQIQSKRAELNSRKRPIRAAQAAVARR